jgi:glycosyltransferase involved in cell wall biosynthesis
LAQNCRWQHIIVDDGSTDDSPRIIQALGADSRVVPVRTACQGQGAALNLGLGLARGDLIAFLDADDEYLPDHLSSHIAAMNGNPGVDIFWGGVEVVAVRDEDIRIPDVAAGFGFMSVFDCGRRGVFEEVRFSEDRAMWWQDFDFIRRAGQRFRADRFYQPTYRYYRNSGESLVDRAKVAWPVG